MSRTTRSFFKASAFALSLAAIGLISAAAQAASINYGNFGPVGGASFLQVTESSGTDPVPLYGPPSAFPVGLDFNPTSFAASSSGGGADITDGQLNYTIASGLGITSVSVSESGDYTLAGAGGAATGVTAGAIIFGTVTEVNGVAVAPISIAPVNASFSDSLPGAAIVTPWSLGATLNIGLPAGQVATRVDVVINNSLVATSEASTAAFIAKKEFIVRGTTGIIPEPGTFALAGMALCSLGLVRRKNA
jgi:hypothetical protein